MSNFVNIGIGAARGGHAGGCGARGRGALAPIERKWKVSVVYITGVGAI